MILTKDNWPLFRDRFTDFAISMGLTVGNILITGTDARANEVEPFFDPDAEDTNKALTKYQITHKLWSDYTTAKTKVVSKLLQHLDVDIRCKVESVEGFHDARKKANLLKLWQIVEEVAYGSSQVNVHAVTYQLVTLKQKGPDDWPSFQRKFTNLVVQLKKFGTDTQIVEAILTSQLVFAMDQEQFKEKLSSIYGSKTWPKYEDLLKELNIFANNTSRIRNLKDNNEGQMAAYNVAGVQSVCWNCGTGKHRKFECKQPKAVCSICGKNHLDKFHALANKQNPNSAEPPSKAASLAGKGRGNKASNKTLNKKRIAEKAINYLADLLKESGALEGDDDAEDQDDDDEEEEHITMENRMARCRIHCNMTKISVEEKEVLTQRLEQVKCFMSATKSKVWFIIDSGCIGVNICKSIEIMTGLRAIKATVSGFLGQGCKATKVGDVPVIGRTVYIKDADANLISVRQLIEMYGGYSVLDKDHFTMYDKDRETVLVGRTNVAGFWIVTYEELLESARAKDRSKVYHVNPTIFSAEQHKRAKEAFELCRENGHPTPEGLARDLENGLYPNTHLTARDVENGKAIFGDCPGCTEGMMKAPPETSSMTPPASKIGEKVHADLKQLPATSIGGNTQLLVVKDEKSSFRTVIALKSKSQEAISAGWDHVIAQYHAYGHTIQQIVTDGENSLRSTKDHLGNKGIRLTHTPAGLHEKTIEREIQEIQKVMRAIDASLPYVVPGSLEAEKWIYAVERMNMRSNGATRPSCPFKMFTGMNPFLTKFYFGQVGLFYVKRKDNPHIRAEWGIFIGYGDTTKSYRAFIPHRNGVYSMRKFVSMPTVPTEWGYKQRIPARDSRGKTLQSPPVIVPVGEPPGMTPITRFIEPTRDAVELLDDADKRDLQNEKGDVITQTVPATAEQPNSDSQNILPPPGPRVEQGTPSVNDDSQLPRQKGDDRPIGPITATEPESMRNMSVDGVPDNNRASRSQNKSSKISEVSNSQSPLENRRIMPHRKSKDNKGWMQGKHANYFVQTVELYHAYRISLRKALKMTDHEKEIKEAIFDEARNMMENVLKPVNFFELSSEDRSQVIRAHMFLKFKYKADGLFDKVKARLVANGDEQDFETIEETYAPTVNPISVFTQLAVTVHRKMYVSAHDVKKAFLLKEITNGKRIIAKIGPEETKLWLMVYPELQPLVAPDGCLYFLLLAYMYGLAEAPNQFNGLADEKIKALGFESSRADPCLYIKKVKEGIIMLSLHVDDMLLSAPTIKWRKWFEESISKSFDLVSQYDNVSYLGMNIEYSKETQSLKLNQSGYVKDIIKKYELENLTKFPKVPYSSELFKESNDSPPVSKRDFLSLVMALMFAARFTRPDILLPVTVLATRNCNPTQHDYSEAIKIVKYLAKDPTVGLVFDGTVPLEPSISADSSHAIHSDGYGQGGIVLTLGSAAVFCRSFKLKTVTRSSSESELVTLEEASTYAVWWKTLLIDLGIMKKDEAILIYQDNLSTIILAQTGGNFKRTKHFVIRESFVRERIKENDVTLLYKCTEDMDADFLTKNLPGPKLHYHLENINVK
jgi:hypothetical protein